MPTLSKAQRRRLADQGFSRRDLEAIEAELGDDDDDDEPEGRNHGRRRSDSEVTVLSGATADRFLESLGFGSDDEDGDAGDAHADDDGEEGSSEEPEPEDEEHEPDAKPASGPRYFRDRERSA